MSARPGPAKVRAITAFLTKEKSFVRTLEGSIRAWLVNADVMSEGAVEAERTYFGSTSIVLPWSLAPDPRLRDTRAALSLTGDPHLRVLALRIARREAESRVRGVLDCMRADLSSYPSASGFVIAVDVEIPIAMQRKAALHS